MFRGRRNSRSSFECWSNATEPFVFGLQIVGRISGVLTPHPSPLPFEGRGRRGGCARRFDWPRRVSTPLRHAGTERGTRGSNLEGRPSLPLSPQRGEGRGEG